MKVIIAGSRDYTDYEELVDTLYRNHCHPEHGLPIFKEVFSGEARGADTLGELWAESMGLPVHRFAALWKIHGRQAGYMRNMEMAVRADALVAFWDGRSKGTKHMIDIALQQGLDVHVYRIDTEANDGES
jgi:hypothetical protein